MVVATSLDADRAAEVGERTYAKARGARSLPPAEPLPFLAAPVTEKVELARTEERRIRKAIAETSVPLSDVSSEVERLMKALEQLARHADVVYGYLSEQDERAVRARLERLQAATSEDPSVTNANAQAIVALEEQLAARAQLERQLSRFDAQMEHLAATLGAIHAQIVRMSVRRKPASSAASPSRCVTFGRKWPPRQMHCRRHTTTSGTREGAEGHRSRALAAVRSGFPRWRSGGARCRLCEARPRRHVRCFADGALLHARARRRDVRAG